MGGQCCKAFCSLKWCPCRCRHGKCSRRRLSLSSCGCCCCCHTPVSTDKLPLLDSSRDVDNSFSSVNGIHLTVNHITIPADNTKFIAKKDSIEKPILRIVTLSDSHMHHSSYSMPKGDLLLIAGDRCKCKTSNNDFNVFTNWLKALIINETTNDNKNENGNSNENKNDEKENTENENAGKCKSHFVVFLFCFVFFFYF